MLPASNGSRDSQCLPELAVIQERLLGTEVSPHSVFKFGDGQPGRGSKVSVRLTVWEDTKKRYKPTSKSVTEKFIPLKNK